MIVAATIRDVARACGVHISTVSRTFSAPHLVNPETRGRVLVAAEELGYRPNRAARALITGRTGNLGLIVADISNPYFPPMIKSAQARARQHDYGIFVADTDEDPQVEQELVETMAKQVDGVVLCSPRMANSAIQRLALDVSLVVINRVVSGVPSVVMDVARGARAAIDHLVGLGHQKLAYVAGPGGSWTNREIRRSALAAARAANVDLQVLGPTPPNQSGGLAAAATVASSGATAVLAYNEVIAVGVLAGLEELGVRVPDDVSVVGVDDTALSTLVRPALTTVATPTAAAGRAAVDLLMHLDDPSGRRGEPQRQPDAHLILQTTLTVRQSTRRPPQSSSQSRSESARRLRTSIKD